MPLRPASAAQLKHDQLLELAVRRIPFASLLGRLDAAHLGAFAILACLVLLTYAQALQIRPLHGDNLTILSWAARADWASFLRGNPLLYPQWRPLAYLTIQLQFWLVGVEHVAWYFVSSLLLLLALGYFVFLLVSVLSGSKLSAMIVASAMVVDERFVEVMKWITGRQTPLAALFGLTALLMVSSTAGGAMRAWHLGAIFLLLLAAPLSKEYGLAFACAVLTYALSKPAEHKRRLAAVAAAAVVVYMGIRLAVVGVGGDYCNQIAFFNQVRELCYGEMEPAARISQYLYNVVASGIGILLPGLLASNGRLSVSPVLVAGSLIWLFLAVVGWRRLLNKTLPMLLLIAFNALLSYLVYRSRNQIVGALGLYASAGVGLAYLLSWAKRQRVNRSLLLLGGFLLIGWTGAQAVQTRQTFDREVATMLRQDPCTALDDPMRYDRELVQHIKHRYGMSNPDCD
jgi:hypothetical protein